MYSEYLEFRILVKYAFADDEKVKRTEEVEKKRKPLWIKISETKWKING